jgi:hypothetical protein
MCGWFPPSNRYLHTCLLPGSRSKPLCPIPVVSVTPDGRPETEVIWISLKRRCLSGAVVSGKCRWTTHGRTRWFNAAIYNTCRRLRWRYLLHCILSFRFSVSNLSALWRAMNMWQNVTNPVQIAVRLFLGIFKGNCVKDEQRASASAFETIAS